jgi:hypothetical protein
VTTSFHRNALECSKKDSKLLGVKFDLQQNTSSISYLTSDCLRPSGVLSVAGDGDFGALGYKQDITRRPNHTDISNALYAALRP